MSDRRYSTARWQRLRKAVLAHYGHVCQLEGPRCTGYATTVHHRVPSSQRPDLFWEPENLISACGACNYGGGARVQADNRRRRTAQLEQVIEQQAQQIARLLEKVAYYENGGVERQRPEPRIYWPARSRARFDAADQAPCWTFGDVPESACSVELYRLIGSSGGRGKRLGVRPPPGPALTAALVRRGLHPSARHGSGRVLRSNR
jgi:hypothetical protein